MNEFLTISYLGVWDISDFRIGIYIEPYSSFSHCIHMSLKASTKAGSASSCTSQVCPTVLLKQCSVIQYYTNNLCLK